MADLSGESTKTGILTARPRRFVLVNKTGALPPINTERLARSRLGSGSRTERFPPGSDAGRAEPCPHLTATGGRGGPEEGHRDRSEG